MPLRCVIWYRPTPSCSPVLKSSTVFSPVAAAASTKASASGCIECESETLSGPPAPWNSEAPRSLSSARLK